MFLKWIFNRRWPPDVHVLHSLVLCDFMLSCWLSSCAILWETLQLRGVIECPVKTLDCRDESDAACSARLRSKRSCKLPVLTCWSCGVPSLIRLRSWALSLGFCINSVSGHAWSTLRFYSLTLRFLAVVLRASSFLLLTSFATCAKRWLLPTVFIMSLCVSC